VSASNSVGSSSRLSGQTSLIRSAPVNTEQPTVFGNPAAGQTLTLGAGEWIGTAPLTYSYQWQRCDSAGANCTAVPGATNHSYLVGGADAGSRMQVVVTAKNGLGAASAASAPATVVTATPTAPSSIALPSVLGLPALGNLLRATDGRWGGFPVPTLSYQWQRCTTAAPASCTGIPGAVATAYRIRSGDVGRSLRIVVTGANTLGTTSASSSPTGRVTAVKAQRRVIAVRSAVLGPSGPRIRLVLVELRGRFNRSYWLELDALRSGRWRHVATARIVRGPLATTTIVGFTAHAQRGAAKVTVRWRDAAGRTDESVFVARPG